MPVGAVARDRDQLCRRRGNAHAEGSRAPASDLAELQVGVASTTGRRRCGEGLAAASASAECCGRSRRSAAIAPLRARARSWHRHGRRPPPCPPAGRRRCLPARRALPADPARRRRLDVRRDRALAARTATARGRGHRPRRRLHGVRRRGTAAAPTTASDGPEQAAPAPARAHPREGRSDKRRRRLFVFVQAAASRADQWPLMSRDSSSLSCASRRMKAGG